jgi:hypothetical protein
MFKLGDMEDPAYAIGVFERHFQRSGLAGSTGFTVLELGHREVAAELRRRALHPPDATAWSTLDDVLEASSATYLTGGLSSLRSLPAGSVDFIWSHAVLEHVDRAEFDETMFELRRLIGDDGVMSHRVDFQDHLSESLHSLRFPRSRWESRLFRTSGFYTNRLRPGELLAACGAAGFMTEVADVDRWEEVPVSRRHLDPEFRSRPDAELTVRGMDFIARPVAHPAASAHTTAGIPMAEQRP